MIRRSGHLLVALGIVAASAVPGSGLGRSGSSPSFRVENQFVDGGTVVAGNVATIEFVFHNDGDREVEILRAAPS